MYTNPLACLDAYEVILASKSPRRHQLLSGLGVSYTVEVREVEEVFPEDIAAEDVPEYLSQLKASAFPQDQLDEKQVVITADTIVLAGGEVIGKPGSQAEAVQMLQGLSGKMHRVITGVSFTTREAQHSFSVASDVWFKELSRNEIEYYIQRCQPFDKAGSYGIQEWIGYIGIEEIKGSFYNVMGLPTQKLYVELIRFMEEVEKA